MLTVHQLLIINTFRFCFRQNTLQKMSEGVKTAPSSGTTPDSLPEELTGVAKFMRQLSLDAKDGFITTEIKNQVKGLVNNSQLNVNNNNSMATAVVSKSKPRRVAHANEQLKPATLQET